VTKFVTKALIVLVVVSCASLAYAQYGDYRGGGTFPNGWRGSIFKGKLIKGEGDQLTLEYKKGDKTQTFVGTFPKDGCGIPRADGAAKAAQPADLDPGTVLMAHYVDDSIKVNGQKQKIKSIVGLTILEYKGQEIDKDHQQFFPCPANIRLVPMAF
jgi:hypothetical protein